jgi:DNA-binding CsgD family transcriptional regulator
MSQSRVSARRWPQHQDRERRETTRHALRQSRQSNDHPGKQANRPVHLFLVPDAGPSAATAPALPGPAQRLARLVVEFGLRHELSARQTEMLQMAITGLHRKESAARMGCSCKTIEGYWRRIHEKTGCSSDAEVVARFIREALTTALVRAKALRLAEGNFPSCSAEAASLL